MEAAIQAALDAIEEQRQVRILYACEAGSRAWGIESEESDYDVRFIYVRPRETYLSLDVPHDVIELPTRGVLDINGWDIYKALRLLRKSNPALLEWLFSPVIYRETSQAIIDMRRIAHAMITPVPLHYHYEHMALGNYRQYIKDKSPVLLKKYLYVIRPLIMLLYLDQHGGKMPFTVNFPAVLAGVELPSEEIRDRIETLVQRKKAGDELSEGQPDPILNAFIEKQLIEVRLEQWKKSIDDSHDRCVLQKETSQVLECVLNGESMKAKDVQEVR